jgi:hypothetical protein
VICDVADPSLLVASHVIGWAERVDTRGDVKNIICLCRFHDALFVSSPGGPHARGGDEPGPLTRGGLFPAEIDRMQTVKDYLVSTDRRPPNQRRLLSAYPDGASPTVLRVRGFRFYFFSREEPRAHVHVQHASGEAKFWLEPTVELAVNYGLNAARLNTALRLVEEHLDEIRSAWAKHFPG